MLSENAAEPRSEVFLLVAPNVFQELLLGAEIEVSGNFQERLDGRRLVVALKQQVAGAAVSKAAASPGVYYPYLATTESRSGR